MRRLFMPVVSHRPPTKWRANLLKPGERMAAARATIVSQKGIYPRICLAAGRHDRESLFPGEDNSSHRSMPFTVACRHPLSCADDKTGKQRGRARPQGAGTHFAHSVTILRSGIDRFVGPESVQSGRVVSLWLVRFASRGGRRGKVALRPRAPSASHSSHSC